MKPWKTEALTAPKIDLRAINKGEKKEEEKKRNH